MNLFLIPIYCLSFLFLFFARGWTDEASFAERIQYLEEQRGYFSKKEKNFKAIVGGELLYWKANVDGVSYATTSKLVPVNGSLGLLSTQVKTRTPHFEYDPGFRLLFGVQSPYDLFDIVFVWTRFYTKGHDRVQGTLVPAIPDSGDKLILDEIGLIKNMDSIPNHASAVCHFKGNLLDLQLGRGIEMSEDFFFRPYFGVRSLWSHLHWDISVKRDFLFPGIFAQESTGLKVKNDFKAVGGLFGMEADWKLPKGFGIVARGAGALVFGRSVEATQEEYTFLPPFSERELEQKYKAHNSTHTVKGLWELFAGLYWQKNIAKLKKYQSKKSNPFELRLVVGYELQQWPLIAQKTNTQITRQRERYSLGFQGLTAGATLVF